MMKIGRVLPLDPVAVVCTTAILLLGYVDYVTGYEFNFFVFYFLPIAAGAWNKGRRQGYGLSILSAVVWFAADWFSGHSYSHSVYAVWNAGARLLAFLLLAYFISKTRMLLVEEREISEQLRDALAQVKTLAGLLPICAVCKKIRNDQGYWQQIEVYISEHSEAQFSHGLCRECFDKFFTEHCLEPPPDAGGE